MWQEVRNRYGEVVGKVLIMPDKNNKGSDLILMEDNKARSMRSTTELVNNLLKNNVSDEELKLVFNFIKLELLRTLERENEDDG